MNHQNQKLSLKNSNAVHEKALLNLDEFCNYVGIGKTKAREILNDPRCNFSFRIGNRLYANKKKLDSRIQTYNRLL